MITDGGESYLKKKYQTPPATATHSKTMNSPANMSIQPLDVSGVIVERRDDVIRLSDVERHRRPLVLDEKPGGPAEDFGDASSERRGRVERRLVPGTKRRQES